MASAYSQDQLDQFLAHVGLPKGLRVEHDYPQDLALLRRLHTHMLSAVPYENLTIHYSKAHTIDLDPQRLFQKIVVEDRGRGGYCMENSLFYNQIPRGLGFRAFTVGVRIRHRVDGVPRGEHIGWVHIVNIVTLPGKTRWMVDVGFGGDGATKPLSLGNGVITRNIGTQDIRLIRDFIPGQTERIEERKLWIYQYRNREDKPLGVDQAYFFWTRLCSMLR